MAKEVSVLPGEVRIFDRDAAVSYAHRWAFDRNPHYNNYDKLGGDCTNFASQCLFSGCGIMNHTPTFGWYYYDANRKAPAWTGVEYLYRFLTRTAPSPGPFAVQASAEELEPGDLVQLSFDGIRYSHSPVVVAAGRGEAKNAILLAAHSDDADNRPLGSYQYTAVRFLHITGVFSA